MENHFNFKGIIFYPEDFLFAVRHWNPEPVGQYILLLCEQVVRGGYIEPKFFEQSCHFEEVKEKFNKSEQGFYYNSRMLVEIDKAKSKSEQAKLASKKRWENKKKNNDANGNANAYANADAIYISNSNKTKRRDTKGGIVKGGNKKNDSGNIVYPWADELFINRWQVWKDFKSEQFKFNYKPMGEQTALKKLQEDSGGDMNAAIEMIETSIANGWRGLFPLDKKGVKVTTPKEADDYMKKVREQWK